MSDNEFHEFSIRVVSEIRCFFCILFCLKIKWSKTLAGENQ